MTTPEYGLDTAKTGDTIEYRIMPGQQFTVRHVTTCDQHDPFTQVHFMYLVTVGAYDQDYLCGNDVRKVS